MHSNVMSSLPSSAPSSSSILQIIPLTEKDGVDNNGFLENNGDSSPVVPRVHKQTDWLFEDSTEETISTGGFTWKGVKDKVRVGCSVGAWRKRLPISIWLPKYSLKDFRGDMVAGLTVGLTVVPQGLAYAAIAQVPLEYGLYTAFMGCFMYTLFGTAKDITLGPTAVLSLMVGASYPKDATAFDKANFAVLMSFCAGISQLVLAVFNLGFLVNFISAPVISGFTTAAAFTILYQQCKSLTGLKFDGDTVVDYSIGYVNTIKNINGWDTLMGIICFTILLLMKDMDLPKKPLMNIPKRVWKILREIVRIFCVTRYAIIIILATGIGYYVTIAGYKGLSIVDTVRGGIPLIGPPPFTWGNRTSAVKNFQEIARFIPMIVLVGALESIAVAKAFAFQFQYRIVPTQELFALGLSNVFCSLFHGYPVTGSFTRSALKAQCGVRTPLGCTWTGAFVLLAMAVISPAFKYVPKAALAAVIMAAILILFDFKIFKDLWLINKKELIPLIVVIIVSFTVSLDYGILSGIGVSFLLLLYPIARPVIIAHFKQSLYSLRPVYPQTGRRTITVDVTPQGAVFFPAAEYLRDFFQDNIIDKTYNEKHVISARRNSQPSTLEIGEIKEEIIFNGIHLTASDYTTLRSLRQVVMSCQTANKSIRFINTDPAVLRIVLPKALRDEAKTTKNGALPSEVDWAKVVLSQSTAERMANISRKIVDAAEENASTMMSLPTVVEEHPDDNSHYDKRKD